MADHKTVKIFTTPACGFCRVVKAYLHSLEVEFEEVDLSRDQEAVQWLNERLGRLGVPITLFGEQDFVLGWQKETIDEHLRRLKLI